MLSLCPGLGYRFHSLQVEIIAIPLRHQGRQVLILQTSLLLQRSLILQTSLALKNRLYTTGHTRHMVDGSRPILPCSERLTAKFASWTTDKSAWSPCIRGSQPAPSFAANCTQLWQLCIPFSAFSTAFRSTSRDRDWLGVAGLACLRDARGERKIAPLPKQT